MMKSAKKLKNIRRIHYIDQMHCNGFVPSLRNDFLHYIGTKQNGSPSILEHIAGRFLYVVPLWHLWIIHRPQLQSHLAT